MKRNASTNSPARARVCRPTTPTSPAALAKRGLILAGLAAALCLTPTVPARAASISASSLLKDMTDLAGMAEFPNPAYTCKQASSYDRKSKTPADQTTEGWFANGDVGQYIRTEENAGRKEYVMMDAAGPGAIVRIWSANPEGVMRIYLDGSTTPVVEGTMADLLGGRFPGLPKPISGEYSKGWNLYLPIPYAKSCKVTSDKGGFYYHVNYRTYPAGTAVESFASGTLAALDPALTRLATRLAAPRGNDSDLGGETAPFDVRVPAGESFSQKLDGPMAITRTVVKVSAANLEAALRGLVLRIRFDDELCVEAPLGDFHGSGPGINAFSTLPLGMNKDGEMYCHWYMPFRESAVIELVNLGKEEVTLAGEVALAQYNWTDASMHFHAKWRAQFDVPTRPMIDWNYLTAKGAGVFAGVSFTIDNPVRAWWGEGDEKIYVDGESFPSHFGTGTEDYYGYAWCWPEPFTHAYHAQPRCDGPGNFGRTSVNRFDIIDRIPFGSSLKFDMELWHWHERSKVNMAVTAYWYAKPGASDAFKAISVADAVVRPMEPYSAPKVAGAIEGESLKILSVKGIADAQEWAEISGEKQLWWHAGMNPGDTLKLALPVAKAGKQRLIGRFLRAKDYGIHQLYVNGQKAGEPIDFYNPDVVPSGEMDLGTYEFKEGDNEIAFTVVGANSKAVKAYMLGLDYLMLKPAN